MSKQQDADLIIDEDEMCESIARKVKVDADVVQDVIDAEVDYWEQNAEDTRGNDTRAITDDLVNFIASEANVGTRDVMKILKEESDYLKSRGI